MSDCKVKTLELLKTYHNGRSVKIRNKIVELNMGLVKQKAHYWSNRSDQPFEDLVQVGCLGLISATERFDATKGYAFSSFAATYISGEIQHYIRDKGHTVKIPRDDFEMLSKLSKLHQESSDFLSDKQIVRKLNISEEEWSNIKLALNNRWCFSLQKPINKEENLYLQDTLPDPKSDYLYERLEINIILEQLDEPLRKTVELIYFKDLTRREAAKILGVTPLTVSRRINKALNNLTSC